MTINLISLIILAIIYVVCAVCATLAFVEAVQWRSGLAEYVLFGGLAALFWYLLLVTWGVV